MRARSRASTSSSSAIWAITCCRTTSIADTSCACTALETISVSRSASAMAVALLAESRSASATCAAAQLSLPIAVPAPASARRVAAGTAARNARCDVAAEAPSAVRRSDNGPPAGMLTSGTASGGAETGSNCPCARSTSRMASEGYRSSLVAQAASAGIVTRISGRRMAEADSMVACSCQSAVHDAVFLCFDR